MNEVWVEDLNCCYWYSCWHWWCCTGASALLLVMLNHMLTFLWKTQCSMMTHVVSRNKFLQYRRCGIWAYEHFHTKLQTSGWVSKESADGDCDGNLASIDSNARPGHDAEDGDGDGDDAKVGAVDGDVFDFLQTDATTKEIPWESIVGGQHLGNKERCAVNIFTK